MSDAPKIDAFCHILTLGYLKRASQLNDSPATAVLRSMRPSLYDLDMRFRLMDRYPNYRQLVTITLPTLEELTSDRSIAVDLARQANDELAAIVRAHPDRFAGFAAALPLGDMDAAMVELDRALNELGAAGAQIFTNAAGLAMDDPRFEPLYARMSGLGKPLWVHPTRTPAMPDYATETRSKYGIYSILGWPYETAVFMTRLIFSGVMERNSGLRILTHHAGGMVPHFAARLGVTLTGTWTTLGGEDSAMPFQLTKPLLDYYQMFYGDTAMSGPCREALECAIAFFGVDHLLFGTDTPFGFEEGEAYVRDIIASVDQLGVGQAERAKIFTGNAQRVLGVR